MTQGGGMARDDTGTVLPRTISSSSRSRNDNNNNDSSNNNNNNDKNEYHNKKNSHRAGEWYVTIKVRRCQVIIVMIGVVVVVAIVTIGRESGA